MMDQILGRNWNYKDEDDNTHYRWRNNNRVGYGGWGGVDRYEDDGHGGKDN